MTVDRILKTVDGVGLSEDQRANFAVAITEALSNAAVHGNRLRPDRDAAGRDADDRGEVGAGTLHGRGVRGGVGAADEGGIQIGHDRRAGGAGRDADRARGEVAASARELRARVGESGGGHEGGHASMVSEGDTSRLRQVLHAIHAVRL